MPDASGDYDRQNDVHTKDPADVRTPSAASADWLKTCKHRSRDGPRGRERGDGFSQKGALASVLGGGEKEERLAGRQQGAYDHVPNEIPRRRHV